LPAQAQAWQTKAIKSQALFLVKHFFSENLESNIMCYVIHQMKGLTSIIVPVVNERLVIADLRQIATEFTQRNRHFEVICIFDIGKSKSVNNLKLKRLPHIRILFYPMQRLGLGFAFCYGFNQSRGDKVFFWEGNFSISPKQTLLYLALMDATEADIVIGSKRHYLSFIYYSPFRRACSKLYQLLIKFFLA